MGTDDTSPALVVACVDGSEGSIRALEHAIDLTRRVSGRLLTLSVLHVGDLERLSERGFELPEPMLTQAQLAFEREIKSEVEHRVADAGVSGHELRMLYGPPAEQILKTLEGEKPYAVVVARTGRSPLSRIVKGSVARTLSEQAKAPVVVVP